MKTPKKKPRNQKMPPEIKEYNREKSQERIFVEHLIRVIKSQQSVIFLLPISWFPISDSKPH
ncbi:MAG: transposase family protein [Moorea sp. SIO2B7]|nr:transposase family protein [Moorena sp. SIO2B7]